jgi:HlyD family type I secretion membrane fusion protein
MDRLKKILSRLKLDDAGPFPKGLILAGIAILAFFFGSLTLWTALAPVEGAVVSPGIIGVSSHRKQIQHLEGGIVKTIHVADGDKVTKGQPLIELRHVTTAAELRRLQGRRTEVLAVIARLEAEQSGADNIEMPDTLSQTQSNPSTESVMNRQTTIFNSNRSLIQDQLSVFEKKIDQSKEEITGLKGRIKYKQQEIKLLSAELRNIRKAVKKGLIPKDEELQLKQKFALLKGNLIGLQSEMGRIEQVVLETEVKKREKQAQLVADLSEKIRSQESDLFDLEQQIIKAKDILERTSIRSPIDGTVVNLQVHSLDGVIESGQSIMEIVPANDELVVEVFLSPEDIDDVSVGMPADVRLTSVSRRQRIPMQGVVTIISADRLNNPQTGMDYYSARVALSPATTDQNHISLIPGMGADVFIRTGARTPIEYLLSPIASSLQFALREN